MSFWEPEGGSQTTSSTVAPMSRPDEFNYMFDDFMNEYYGGRTPEQEEYQRLKVCLTRDNMPLERHTMSW